MLVLRSVQSGQVLRIDTSTISDDCKGGEGFVYPTGNGRIAKVYHEDNRTPERASKLATMVKNRPSRLSREDGKAPIVAWPVDLLEQTSGPRKGMVVGYLMSEVKGADLGEIYHPGARREFFPLVGYDYLLRCAASVAQVVALLHKEGYVLGDINESNFLVSGSGEVTAIDADSFQVRDPSNGSVHYCTVGKPEYTPPELLGKDFSATERKPEHDCYSLAVLIFQILTGQLPTNARYTGIGDPSDKFVFPYDKPKESYKPNYLPPPGAPDFEILPEPLRELSKECFRTGIRSPSVRPTAEDWMYALRHAEQNLTTCLWNSQHKYSPHLEQFGGYLKQCPWCRRKKDRRDGQDLFPSRFRVGVEHVDKDERPGFLQVAMPGKREGIGAMGVVGVIVGYGNKYVLQSADSDGLAEGDDSNKSRLQQQAPEQGYLRMLLLATVMLLPLAWGISSIADLYNPSPEVSSERASPSYAVQIDTERLKVRAGPSTSYEVLTTVEKREQFDVLDARSGWQQVRVRLGSGQRREGWIYSEYTKRVGERENERTATTQTSKTDQGQGTSASSNSESDSQGNSTGGDETSQDNSSSEEEKGEDEASTTERPVPVEVFSVDGPNKLTVGEEAAFSATANDDQVTASLSYRWEFGDGTTSEGLQATHSYREPGTYTVRFQASDDRTSDEISETVKVEERSPTSISFNPEASTTAEMEGNRFTITVLSGEAVVQKGESTKLELNVQQKSENFDGKWVRWGHILDESYLDGPRGRAYDVDRSESENLGSGRVQPGDTRTGTVVFRVDAPPDELDRVTLNFTYFPYQDGRTVEIPLSIQ